MLQKTETAPRVLMVCTGNICRSAMAEVMAKKMASDAAVELAVDSCGISNEEYGNPIDHRAQQVLRESGYDIPRHRARQIDESDLRGSDLILAMTSGHYRAIERLIARMGVDQFHGKLRMLRDFEPARADERADNWNQQYSAARGDRDLEDPWYGDMDDFWTTYNTLDRCLPQVIDALS